MHEKTSRPRSAAALTVITAALTALCTSGSSASPPPGLRPVLSTYEIAAGRVILRDCATPAPIHLEVVGYPR